MASGDEKISKIQTHFKTLSTAATSLNAASDELTKVVGVLDEALKKLNVGLTVWVTISKWADDMREGENEIGYCKVNGKWGIALLRSYSDDMVEADGPWLFNDAPRELRLSGVDKIPEVMEKLGQAASTTAKRIQEKTQEVRDLADAVTQIATAESITRLVTRGKLPTALERIGAEQRKSLGIPPVIFPKDGGK